MQVPGPFEYERATSVDHAVGLLDRLGEGALIVAGGHSLLPMMKLRIANPEYLIDINDLAAELGYIIIGADAGADRRDDATPRGARLRRARGGMPDLPRRRAGDRRSGGTQPRHRGRVAVPGRPGRGSHDGLHGARRRLRGPRAGGAAGDSDRRLPRRVPTKPRWRTTRCSSRFGSRCGTTHPVPMRRSNAGWAIGR